MQGGWLLGVADVCFGLGGLELKLKETGGEFRGYRSSIRLLGFRV